MKFEIGKPIPKNLRNVLSNILEKRDIAEISLKEDMPSESSIRNLLKGWEVSDYTHNGVMEMVRVARNKCDDGIVRFERFSNIIKEYETKVSQQF